MAEKKKFGTFAGVFTPSILTILGVIMYLRLGWVVGNAGVWGTLIIILIAHVISLATGLSISSIATDKKVGPGGVYYVLSRSLGLPIGGAIGITLFVGTALSIALYLVGFAESFNSYLGFDTSINGLRITGSIALLTLMTIALISTAVALKTQFIIMAAIGISLISIFLGLAGQESQPFNSFGVEGGASMEMVFAIFFPAVTGFTAGIAMSGDLKNSKKAIPSGTLWAIIVGLIIYIVLAIAISMSIESGLLVADNNILLTVAYSAPAVVAGIWGATLSSALGGILGGPRILQAMSIDKITPKIFSKGRGKDQEPWNALFLVVFIAQCGILIGELDMIARVVSMFYLAAYGFINISFVLESWASTDFNPTFRVRKWVGLVGAIACFAVMFKLDMIAMLAAFVLIGAIYFWLHRKQVSLGTGDIWHSVWNSVVQRGLKKLEDKEDHLRNWKPNVLLFSGGTEQRPHLLELSRSLSGKAGMVTNFDLVENPDAKILFPKHKQVVKDPLLEQFGIFGRKVEVQNVFKGIESIASTFGFSGVEPNSVLMGWAKNTQDPLWFAQMTKRLIELDLNVMYLDYDERFGFGKKKSIDIWWRDLNDNVELSLNIIKFLSQSEDWRQAEIRVIVVNNTLDEGIERKVHGKLDDLRIQATVKVINNAIEKREFYEIMESTSEGTDLILAGIPGIEEGEEADFVSKTNSLFKVLGTTLLLKSSSLLEGERIELNSSDLLNHEKSTLIDIEPAELILDKDENLKAHVVVIHKQLQELGIEITENELFSFKNKFGNMLSFLNEILAEEISLILEKKDVKMSDIRASQIRLLDIYNKKIEEFIENDIDYLDHKLKDISEKFYKGVKEIALHQPISIEINPSMDKLKINDGDSKIEKLAKKRKKRFSFIKTPKVVVPFRNMVVFHLTNSGYQNILSFQRKIGLSTYSYQNQIREVFIENLRILESILLEKDTVQSEVSTRFKSLHTLLTDQHNYLHTYLNESATYLSNLISHDTALISAPDVARQMKNKKSQKINLETQISTFSQHWVRNQICASNQTALDISLHKVSYTLSAIAVRLKSEIKESMFNKSRTIISESKDLISQIEKELKSNNLEALTDIDFNIPETISYNGLVIDLIMSEIQQLVNQLPESVLALDEESRNNFAFEQGESVHTFEIDILHIADYLIDQQVQLPTESELQLIPIECMKNLGQLIQNLRLINFTVSAHISEEDKQSQLKTILAKTVKIIEDSESNISQLEKRTIGRIEDIYATCISNLNASYIIEEARDLEATSKDGLRKSKNLKWIKNQKSKISNGWQYILQKIYSKKEDIVYASFKYQNKENENVHAKMRSYLENLSPNSKILTVLPFYYQQLFTGKHSPKLEFLNNRDRELNEVQNTIERMEKGANGGILVLGDSLAGKTFFSEIVARKYSTGKVFKIEAPITGSPREKDMLHVLQKHLKSKNSTIGMIEDAPLGSYFIFDDVELWWERSPNGGGALKLLTEIIEKYSHQYRFIVNCNLSAFKLIKLSEEFQNYFVSTIQLTPFNSRNLRETIIERHNAGGLEFVIDGVHENDLPERKLRKLMDEYTYLSQGNIGVALHLWQANIESIDKNVIMIKHPNKEEMPLLTNTDWQVLLVQFVIHKHLTIARIKRIFDHSDKKQSEDLLNNLMRSGLVEQIMGSTYRIPPYLTGAVSKYLKESKVL